MPDLNHAINDHRVQLIQWWRTSRYRAAVDRLKQEKPRCERCGKPTTTALHDPSDYLQGYEHYVSVVEKLTVPAGCQRCNREELRNRGPCPECVKEYRNNPEWKIRYILADDLICFAHLPQEDQIRLKHMARIHRLNRTATMKFPCKFRLVRQGCANSRHVGACGRSAIHAEGCDYFQERKKMEIKNV